VSDIPLARPDLTDVEKNYVNNAIETSWISSIGEYLTRFESEFAGLCETKRAFAVANGTVALHLAMLALDIGPGDEVIVPSLTYIASVNAITYVGATPVFVDIDPTSWCLSPVAVAAAITDRTKAIVVVHLYGQPADMAALRALATPRGISLIEDAAEAPLATYRGKPTGGLGDIGTFSFYGNKIFTSGEGGALTVDDDGALARKIHMLRGQGMDPERRYYFPIVGYNYRLTNIAAAFLCAQLDRREGILQRRAEIFARYDSNLRDVPGIQLQAYLPDRTRAAWLYSVVVEDEFGRSRDDTADHLQRRGIETRPFFIPIHTLPPYHSARTGSDLSHTTWLSHRGLNLPTFVQLTDAEIDRVCDVLVAART